MKVGFFILARSPSPSTVFFAQELSEIRDHVVLVTDTPTGLASGTLEVAYLEDALASAAGYIHSSPLIPKTPIAWDKALYLMATRDYDFAWFCEDDVLFISPEAAHQLVESYSSSTDDLLAQRFFTPSEWPQWKHWQRETRFSRDVLTGGFFPLCRISRRLIGRVDEIARAHGSLSFIETMLPSAARLGGHGLRPLKELGEEQFRADPPLSRLELGIAVSKGAVVFHPVKEDSLRAQILAEEKAGSLRPKA